MDPVAPPPSQQAPVFAPNPTRPEPTEDEIKTSVLTFLNAANEIKFHDVQISGYGKSLSGNATIDTVAASGVGFEMYWAPRRAFGWQTSLAYYFPRDIKAINLAVGGFTRSSTAGQSVRLSLYELTTNAVYRWDRMYALGGLNYSFPDLK